MPRIKEYTARSELSAEPLGALARAQQAGASARAEEIRGLGRTMQGIVEDVEKHVERQETSKLAADLAMTQANLAAEWQQTLKAADPNDPEVSSRFLEQRVKPALEGHGDGLWTTGAKDFYEKVRGQVSAHMFESTTADQMRLAGAAQIVNLDRIGEAATATAGQDPAALDAQLGLLRINIDTIGSGLTQAQRDELFDKYAQSAEQSSWLAKIDRNAGAALQELQSGSRRLTGQQRQTLIDRARDRMMVNQDEDLSVKRFAFANDLIRIENGFAAKNDWSEQDAMLLAGRKRDGSLDEGAALRYRQQLQEAKAVGGEIHGTRELSFAERAERVAALRQEIGTAPDALVAEKRAAMAERVLVAQEQAYKANPAQYVAETNSFIGQAHDRFLAERTPENFQRYAAASLAEQQRLKPTGAPVLVTPGMKAEILGKLEETNSAGGAQAAAKLLGEWKAASGDQFGIVVKNLGKDMKPSDYTAASLFVAGKENFAKEVLQASTDEAKAFVKNNIAGASKTLVEGAVARALEKMAATMPDDPGTVNAMTEGLTNLALWRRAHGQAVDAASLVKETVTGAYTFRGAVRIPKEFSADKVMSNLRRQVGGATIVADPLPGLSLEESAKIFKERVRVNGVWTTTRDGQGVYLINGDTGNVVYELDPATQKPVPLVRSFSDMVK